MAYWAMRRLAKSGREIYEERSGMDQRDDDCRIDPDGDEESATELDLWVSDAEDDVES